MFEVPPPIWAAIEFRYWLTQRAGPGASARGELGAWRDMAKLWHAVVAPPNVNCAGRESGEPPARPIRERGAYGSLFDP